MAKRLAALMGEIRSVWIASLSQVETLAATAGWP